MGALGSLFSIRAVLLTSGLILSPVLGLFARVLRREGVREASGYY